VILDALLTKGRRASRNQRPHGVDTTRVVWAVASAFLDHPDDRLLEGSSSYRSALAQLPAELRDSLIGYLDVLDHVGLAQLQREFVDTFDLTRRCAPYLTYATCGDTRRRGVELVRFKQAFREAGVEFDEASGELPDHVAAVLQLAAVPGGFEIAWRLLCQYRVSLELLFRALNQHRPSTPGLTNSPWAGVVGAVRATMPALAGSDEEVLLRLVEQGPPGETVGLDEELSPYDPRLIDYHSQTTPAPTFLGADIPVGELR